MKNLKIIFVFLMASACHLQSAEVTTSSLKKDFDHLSKKFDANEKTLKTMLKTIQEMKKDIDSVKSEVGKVTNTQKTSNSLDLQKIQIKYANNVHGLSMLHAAIRENDINAISILLDNGADANSIYGNFTAIGRAARWNRLDIAKMLLKRGANVTLVAEDDPNTYFPLKYAVEFGSGEIVSLFIDHGADITRLSLDDQNSFATPLHIAAKAGNYEGVMALLEAGADVNGEVPPNTRVDHWTKGTPMDWAVSTLRYEDNPENLEIVKALYERGGQRAVLRTTNVPCPIIKAFLDNKGA